MINRTLAIATPLAAVGLLLALLFAGDGSQILRARSDGATGSERWPIPETTIPGVAPEYGPQTGAVETNLVAESSPSLLMIWGSVINPKVSVSPPKPANEAESSEELPRHEIRRLESSSRVIETPELGLQGTSIRVPEQTVRTPALESEEVSVPPVEPAPTCAGTVVCAGPLAIDAPSLSKTPNVLGG